MKKITLILLTILNITAHAEISIEELYSPYEFKNMIISPNGKRIAAVQEGDSRDKLAILDLAEMKVLSSFEFGENRRLGNLSWVSNDFVTMNVSKFVGNLDRKGRYEGVFLAKYNGSVREYIFSGDGDGLTAGQLRDALPDEPRQILVTTYPGNSIKKYNIKSKRSSSLALPKPGIGYNIGGYFLGKNQKARFFTEYNEERDVKYHYLPANQIKWRELKVASTSYDLILRAAGHSENPDVIYVLSNHENPVLGLYKLYLNTGELKFVYRHEFVDIDGTIENTAGELVGLTIEPDYPMTVWLDNKAPFATKVMALQASFPDQEVSIISASEKGDKSVVWVRSDRNPGDFYLFNSKDSKLEYLASSRLNVKPEMFSAMKPISLKARDGVELHGYLTLPKGKEPKDLPLVVNPHGGPHGIRDNWGFSRDTQLLADRGYAVLQINFRGSGGYGQAFIESGYLKWGREMQDDVTDATLWAVEQGYADKDRLCIYGGSYGGYAALQGVVREPDLYKCAVGYVGVYDLEQFKTCGDGAGDTMRTNLLAEYVGTDKDIHRKYSPAYNADTIKADLFIAHGSDDVRVPMCQGNALKKGLEEAGKEFIWMVKDEGHGYQKLENQKDFYGTMLTFLQKNIGKKEVPAIASGD